ncbi:MAG: efflux RND transporter periplasmic adaptor subunit [Burkholderiaceae bacterium]
MPRMPRTAHPSTPFYAAVMACGLALLVSGCGGQAQGQGGGPPPAAPVSVAPAVERPVADTEEFTGRIEALESVDIRPRVGGTVERVHFRDGARVRKGELLFSIDARPLQAELARAEAALAASLSRANLAKAELARAQSLLGSQAISKQEFDQLSAGASTAGTDTAAAQANVRLAKINLDYTAVRAPIAGRASRALITAGNLVNEQSILTSVVATQKVYAYFDGSEQTFLRFRKTGTGNLKVTMGLANEAGYPHSGKIDFIDNRLNVQTGAIRLRAVFDNAANLFTPGLLARLQVSGAATYPAVLTPERAIGTDQSKKFVFVVPAGAKGAPAQAEFREVQLGALMDGMRVVTQGLKAGELVVVNGLQRVRPGAPVLPEVLAVDAKGLPIEPPPAPPGAPPGAPPSGDKPADKKAAAASKSARTNPARKDLSAERSA